MINKSTTHPPSGFKSARKPISLLTLAMLLLMLVGSSLASPFAPTNNPAPVQTFYVPFPEDEVYESLRTIFPGNSETANNGETCPNFGSSAPGEIINTYISLALSSNNTIIYYDHWEDDYETDITAPASSTTEIWGDGDPSNGYPPGYSSDLIFAGDVIILSTATDLNSLSDIDYDGRDKISSTEQVAVTRAAWLDGSNTLLAGGLEMYPTYVWGTEYVTPIGIDQDVNDMFSYTGVTIMAQQDNTQVTIDPDLSGSPIVVTLNEGESYLVNGGMVAGATINSDRPVQVDLITGDYCAGYESRWFTLFPTQFWSNSYYTPVGTPVSGDVVAPTYVHLYNPNSTPITVDWEVSGGVAQPAITIPASSSEYVTVPNESAAHFFTNDESLFNAIATVDSEQVGSSDENLTHDWGFALVPEKEMTQAVLIAWGDGDDPTYTGSDSENTSPIWLTAAYPTGSSSSGPVEVCIDYNGDGGALEDLITNRTYDEKLDVTILSSNRVYDADGDQTGMQMWVCDGSDGIITAVWGQDPNTASGGSPAIDVGTTLPGLSPFAVAKFVDIDTDTDENGVYSIGDIVEYTIIVDNIGLLPIPGNSITVTDNLPDDVSYIADSTIVFNSLDQSQALPDDSPTIFPLDSAGYDYPDLLDANTAFAITFKARIDSVPEDTIIVNYAFASGQNKFLSDSASLTVPSGVIGDRIWFDANRDGQQGGSDEPGIPEVVVNLYDGDGDLIGTTTTDINGNYSFTNLPPGEYTVEVDTSTISENSENTYDPDQIGDPNSATLTLGVAEVNNDIDFGYYGEPLAVSFSQGSTSSQLNMIVMGALGLLLVALAGIFILSRGKQNA